MRDVSVINSAKMLRVYYAATLIFVILDYYMNINVRLAFLEAWPEMRAIYYLLLFVCLGLMILRPGWSLWIGTVESMLAASLLIVTMGVRVMTMSEQMLRTGSGLVTMSEIMNFMIVGLAGSVAFRRGIAAIHKQSRVKW
jgi:ABC-type transport system involved in cytochrome c biogenesis permease subunit